MLNVTPLTTKRDRVVVVSWLFGYPWDPTRGVYNQQQFDRLAKRVDLSVMVAVPWTVVLRNFSAFLNALKSPTSRGYPVRYFVSFHLPGAGRSLSGMLYFFSMLLQLLIPILGKRPSCLIGSWSYPDGVATAALGKLLRIPVVLKVHGSDVNVYTLSAARRWQIRWACNQASRVVCVSQALGNRLIEIGVKAEKISVNYNGVDPDKFSIASQADARSALQIESAVPVVLFVGNLLFTKGAGDLFEAFRILRERRPDALLVYVGDGADRPTLEQRVQAAGLASAVRFTGKQPHAVLGQWYAAANLTSLPSHAEGVPNVILEAMACGQPVVATRVGGIPEVLPEFAGFVVEPHDPKALANALDETLARQWDHSSIAAHASSFTWERNVDMMQDVLHAAIAAR